MVICDEIPACAGMTEKNRGTVYGINTINDLRISNFDLRLRTASDK